MGSGGPSTALTRSSLDVLRRHAGLLAIPLGALAAAGGTTAAAAVLVRASLAPRVREFGSAYHTTGFGLPGPSGSSATTVTTIVPTPLTALVVLAAVTALALIAAFAAAAVAAATRATLTGERLSIARALGLAFVRGPQLLAWVAYGGTAGLARRLLEKRALLGAVPARVNRMTWRWATWLALPAIVAEGTGPRRTLRRSADLVHAGWGPEVVVRTGLGWLGTALVAPGLLAAVLVAPRTGPAGWALAAGLTAGALVVATTLSTVGRTALYLHATGHAVPGFAPAGFAAAFERVTVRPCPTPSPSPSTMPSPSSPSTTARSTPFPTMSWPRSGPAWPTPSPASAPWPSSGDPESSAPAST
jgi:hypothetical protein